jgi:hypothetical protein
VESRATFLDGILALAFSLDVVMPGGIPALIPRMIGVFLMLFIGESPLDLYSPAFLPVTGKARYLFQYLLHRDFHVMHQLGFFRWGLAGVFPCEYTSQAESGN